MDDATLIDACRRNDEAAWAILVERSSNLIFALARHAGLSPEDAADVRQRVFVALLEHLGTIEHPEHLAAWLITTTRHMAWRLRCHEQYLPVISVSDDDNPLLADQDDPAPLAEALLEHLEQHAIVLRALAALDERCRTLLTMLFLQPEPASNAEIAAALGISEGAIGPTRARCLEKLRRILLCADSTNMTASRAGR
ncbi:MAG: sigma-70 family RNA polymerase sigma factor [Chloroflexaceae bacterium]